MTKKKHGKLLNKDPKPQEIIQRGQVMAPLELHLADFERPDPEAISTVAGIRNEMTKVYRLVCAGKIRMEDATKLVYMLKEMVQVAKAEAELGALNDAYVKQWAGVQIIRPDEEVADD